MADYPFLTSYAVGTATVQNGQTVVTGINTLWQDQNNAALSPIRAGDLFGTHKGFAIRVKEVNSPTQITLAYGWPGPSQTDAPYEIQLTPRIVGSQEAMRLLAKQLSGPEITSLLALSGAPNTLGYFGSQDTFAETPFGANARALLAGGVLPNAQLPARLKSLVTPVADLNTINETGWSGAFDTSTNVPIAGFYLVHTEVWVDGTYAVQFAYSLFNTEAAFRRHKVNGVWQPWRAAGQVAVGTVSQSSGMPLGAIIERGGNGNGQYTRFADGTQICNHFVVMNGLDNKRLYRGWQFPAVFSSPPYIASGIDLTSFIAAGFPISNGGSIGYASSVDLTVSSATMSVETNYAGMASGINVVGLYATATGRWF